MGALDGTRVIDFGQYIAGPMAAMLLADQGADVIRVDPPGGPRWDTPANVTWNRGKRSIVLDLKSAGDSTTARRLIETADVVIENFRPGVMDRLGLGPKAMRATNPRLVYCSMPGFASDDPRAGVAAWEGVVAAATGTYRTRLMPGEEMSQPVYTAVPIASSYAAFQAAASVAMALIARERDGVGQLIEVPLFDGMFAAIGGRGLRVHDAPNGPPRGALSWTRQFECGDGRWVQFHTGNTKTLEFAELAGVTEWHARGLFDRERLASDEALVAEQAEKSVELFRSRTAQQWEDLVAEAGSECGVCRTSAEWIDHPHARGSQIIIESEHPRLGRLRQPGINVRMSETPGAVRRPAPEPDADRPELLAELAELEAASPPTLPDATSFDETMHGALEGVKVLDLCIILAGPTCGRTLAEFGADVIKVDDPGRGGIVFHNDVNRGKRSILIDLKSEEGIELFWQLVDQVDVVVQNYRKGAVDRLGIGYEEVRKRRPDIIYASLNAYGHIGPWAGRPGHEQLAQAVTGMQARYGGEGERPMLAPFAVNDYGTGIMGAYGVALALLHRKRTGRGQHVDSALTYTATMLQSAFMLDYDGKTWDEPQGQNSLGSGPLHRAYQASDGWLFLGARSDDRGRLAGVDGLAGVESLEGDTLAAALAERILGDTVEAWVGRLTARDIGASPVLADVGELMQDPWVVDHGLSVTRDHDGFGPVTTTGPGVRLSGTPPAPGRPAPAPGSDAASILDGIDRGGDLDALVASGAIATSGIAR